jgi:hypothetical protein
VILAAGLTAFAAAVDSWPKWEGLLAGDKPGKLKHIPQDEKYAASQKNGHRCAVAEERRPVPGNPRESKALLAAKRQGIRNYLKMARTSLVVIPAKPESRFFKGFWTPAIAGVTA